MAKRTSLIQERPNPFTGQMMEVVVFPTDLAEDGKASVGLARSAKSITAKKITKEGCRFGGPALLPKKDAWPEGPDGPLTLIGQLDFAELAKVHKGELALPKAGILSLFYDLERMPAGLERSDARYWRVVYVDDPKSGTLHEPEDDDPTPPFALTPTSRKVKNAPLHKVGGVGDWIQEDPRAAVALMAEGIECSARGIRAASKKGLSEASLAKRMASWKLLWQIDSDDSVGFSWHDSGMLYLFITEKDLAARRFDRAWIHLQCH